MAIVLENIKFSDEYYLLKVQQKNEARFGQFYMLKAWDDFPILARPISVFDANENEISFLYKVVGKGTKIFTELKNGDEIYCDGPHGNGFPEDLKGNIAMIGGGIGIAPLYLAAKVYKKNHANTKIDLQIKGVRGLPLLTDKFKTVADEVFMLDPGKYITDGISPDKYDYIITCGPEVMMEALCKNAKKQGLNAKIFVSIENRMACGIGACLVCTCKTKNGNKKACKDGPIFLGSEVYYD